ncbi:hypothetical protein SprV_0401458100 [Sparganum proliferum]
MHKTKVQLEALYESRDAHSRCCSSTPILRFQRMATAQELDVFTSVHSDSAFRQQVAGLVVDAFTTWNSTEKCDRQQLEGAFRKAYDVVWTTTWFELQTIHQLGRPVLQPVHCTY